MRLGLNGLIQPLLDCQVADSGLLGGSGSANEHVASSALKATATNSMLVVDARNTGVTNGYFASSVGLLSPAAQLSGGGAHTNGGVFAWTAKEVEAGLLSGRLEPEVVLRELRRLVPGSELRLSDAATRLLSGSYGTALAPLCSAQLMMTFREVTGMPRAAIASSPPIPSPIALSELRLELQ